MKAIIVVDMLKDFCLPQGKLYVKEVEEIIPKILELLEKARTNNVPIFYVCDWHDPNDPEFEEWPQHCVKGTEGAEVIPELDPKKVGGEELKKQKFSGFTNPELKKMLKEKNVTDIFVVGVCTEYCDKSTALDAIEEGYTTWIVTDCIKPASKEDGEKALEEMKTAGIKEISSKEIF